MTLVTIQGAHTLDLAISVLGPFAEIGAMATTQYLDVEIGDGGTHARRSTPDHLLVQARLARAGAVSLEIAGGRPPETPFRMDVCGEEGVLSLDGGAARGFQSGRLRLCVNGETQPLAEGETRAMPDTAANVAGIYAALRDDILGGTAMTPDFQHSVRLARLVDDVLTSAKSGTRRPGEGWPGNP